MRKRHPLADYELLFSGDDLNLQAKLNGANGGFTCFLLHGSEHMKNIARKGWTGQARQRRLAKHKRSIVLARAKLTELREARKKFGEDYLFQRFREKILAAPDPKAELRRILKGS
jgi:hypothetical protein